MKLRIIHFSFLMSIFMYLAIGFYFGRMSAARVDVGFDLDILAWILGAVFLSEILAAPLLARRVLESPQPTTDRPSLAPRMRAHLIKLALYQCGPLYGLLLVFLGATFDYLLIFSFPAIVLMLLSIPRE